MGGGREMSQRPTPETDAAWQPGFNEVHRYMTTHRLERQRDEAREKAERYRLEANAMMMQREEWYHKAHVNVAFTFEARAERDRLREVLREIQVANWRTAGELRGMARRALEGETENPTETQKEPTPNPIETQPNPKQTDR